MPARCIGDDPIGVNPYDVTAMESSYEPGLPCHAMLVIEEEPQAAVSRDTVLKHFHMGPPLEEYLSTIYACGTSGLSGAEARQIKVFVDDQRSQKAAEDARRNLLGRVPMSSTQYRLVPDVLSPTAQSPYFRFSCVGFVRQSYRQAGIELLSEDIPLRTLGELKNLYPERVNYLESKAAREKILGLGGDGPWAVALVGYLLHSLARESKEIRDTPFSPQPSDSYFN